MVKFLPVPECRVEVEVERKKKKTTRTQKGEESLATGDAFQGNQLLRYDVLEKQHNVLSEKPFYGIPEQGTFRAIGGSHKSSNGLYYLVAETNQLSADGFSHVYSSVSIGEPGGSSTKYLSPGVGVTVGERTLIYLATGAQKGKSSSLLVSNMDLSDVEAISSSDVTSLKPPERNPELNLIARAVQEYGKKFLATREANLKGNGGDENLTSPESGVAILPSSGKVSLGLGDDLSDQAFIHTWAPINAKQVPVQHSSALPHGVSTGRLYKQSGSKKKGRAKNPSKRVEMSVEGSSSDVNSSIRTEKARKTETSPSNIIGTAVEQQNMHSLDPQTIADMAQVFQQQLGGIHHIGGNLELHFHFDGPKK